MTLFNKIRLVCLQLTIILVIGSAGPSSAELADIRELRDVALEFMIGLDKAQRFERCPDVVHIDPHYYYFSFSKIDKEVSTPDFIVLVDRVNKKAMRIEDGEYALFQGEFVGSKQ